MYFRYIVVQLHLWARLLQSLGEDVCVEKVAQWCILVRLELRQPSIATKLNHRNNTSGSTLNSVANAGLYGIPYIDYKMQGQKRSFEFIWSTY